MKLIVRTINPHNPIAANDDRVYSYEIGEDKEFKTWYWGQAVTIEGISPCNLVIKRWCHAGCRIEIPRERILSVQIETNAHHGKEITHADIRALADQYDEITKS